MVDFDTLEAGRETNDLMATRVMGWEVLHVGYIGMEDESERQRELSDWLDTLNVVSVGDHYIDVSKNFIVQVEDWDPSTDIKAAWEVVEKFPAIVIQRASSPDGSKVGYRCSLPLEPNNPRRSGQSVASIDADADTAPLAICRVALKAMQSASAQAAS